MGMHRRGNLRPSAGYRDEKKRVKRRLWPVNKDLPPAASILLGFLPSEGKLYSRKSNLSMQYNSFSPKACWMAVYTMKKCNCHQKRVLKGYLTSPRQTH